MSDFSVTDEGVAVRRLFIGLGDLLARYTRFELVDERPLPEGGCLIVLNHGFGTLADLNVLLAAHVINRLAAGIDQPAVLLAHRFAWVLGIGRLLEPAGFRSADRDVALEALAAGVPVVLIPGGDLEAAKPWTRRHDVSFFGRDGFARTAQKAQVPIVPIVITGAGDTLLNLSDGRRLARLLRLDRTIRQKALPISVALPWGLNVGLAYFGYAPLPAKMRGAVCEPVMVPPGADPAEVARDIETTMNEISHRLTDGRNPYRDWLIPPGHRELGDADS